MTVHSALHPSIGKHRTWRDVLSSDLGVLVLLALALVGFHLLTNGQYGFHRDELDTLDNARSLAWGYVAYPPVTAFFGRLGLELFGPSLRGVRLFSALAMGVVLVLTGLMARDLGGKRPAQVVAALAGAIAPVAVTGGVLLHYLSFDYLWWVTVAFCVIRVLKTENPRWWLGVGAAIGLGMLTKYTMAFLVAGVVAGVLLTRARRYLRSPWLWAGAGLALLIFLPHLLWQVQHDFITLEFLGSIHRRDIAWGRTDRFLTEQLYSCINLFTIPLAVAGLYFYFFAAAGRPFRAVGWMYAAPAVLLLAAKGRSYYLAPAYPMLLAAGAVWGESWVSNLRPWPARIVKGGVAMALALGAVVAVLSSAPVTPVNSPLWKAADGLSQVYREMIGWPELVETVAGIYDKLPAEEREHTAILTANYGETGAVNLYGPALGLPEAISGTNSAWERGYGDPPPETVILVGFGPSLAQRIFKNCRYGGKVTNALGVKNEETTRQPDILICKEPREPWPVMWPKMRNFG